MGSAVSEATTPAGEAGDGGACRFDRVGSIAATAAILVAVDQLTKWWAYEALVDGDVDVVWTLRLHLVFNTGSAFSLGSNLGPLLGVLAVAVAAGLLWYGRFTADRRTTLALGLVAGGALGNFGDRAFRDGDGLLGGAVVDFIDLQWWPVFNVADAAITIGGALLVLFASRAHE